MSVPIGPGARVTLRFSLALAGGGLIDEVMDEPATFDVGDGTLLPGFERAMFGMKAGERADLPISCEQGFGAPNDDNVHIIRRAEFSNKLALEEGLVVSFSDADGKELPGVITRLFTDTVEVDFNHPLAGKALLFSVEIVAVEQISDDILRV